MTDWWTRIDSAIDGSFEKNNLADMVKAQNDIYMVVPDAENFADDMPKAYESGYLTLGELQRSAKNLLNFVMKSYSFKIGRKTVLYNLESAKKCVLKAKIKRLTDAIEVSVPKAGWYCAEIQYCLPCSDLEQKTLNICINDPVPHSFLCHGTEGKIEYIRQRLYFTKTALVWLTSEGADSSNWDCLALSIYELE